VRYVLVLVCALAGCGYHLAGEGSGLPEEVHSLSVGTIVNRSREHGLEKSLAFAFEQEVVVRRHFRFRGDPAGADAVLSGTIRELTAHPVAFSSSDQALQYELILVLDLTLTRQRDGRALWRVDGLRESDEYSTNSQVVITSSSQFQQGTLNAGDLPCEPNSTQPCNPQFTNIQLAETLRRRAIGRLLKRAVRDVYNDMVEDF
jgi:hypothetical protein